MTPLIDELAPAWTQRLRELVDRLDVPGAVLGVSHRGQRFLVAAGVAGLRNPQPVSPATVFQLGSISKVYTATLLLLLGGAEILERSVTEVIPDADWLDPAIRVRHLLTHSSGLAGDLFADTGRGDDALARYLTELRGHPPDVPLAPGTRYSYCNSGYAVLGRIIEALSGQPYDTALRARLLEPLGVHATSTLAEDTILRPVALGHNRTDSMPLRPDDSWNFPRACNPLGGVCATAGDVLAFAELHLRDGHTADRTPLLDDGLAALMRRRHLETPALARPSARGLGWGVFDWSGGELVGHDGETLGQTATLRLLPAHELALVVLTNALPDGDEIATELTDSVLAPWGLVRPIIEAPSDDVAASFDPAPYVGRYRNLMATFEVTAAEGGLTVTSHHAAAGLEPEIEVTRLNPIGGGAFIDADVIRPTRATRFADADVDGRCRSYFNGRIAWRIDPPGE